MEHVIQAPRGGIVRAVAVAAGDTVFEGHRSSCIERARGRGRRRDAPRSRSTSTHIRPDLAEVHRAPRA